MLHSRYLRSVGSYSIGACKAETRQFGCIFAASSKPFFGTNSLGHKRRQASHRHFRSVTESMAKADDPSQAFHSGQAKARSALDETSDGEFKRTDSTYREHIEKGTRFEPEGMSLRRTWCMLLIVSAQCWHAQYSVLCVMSSSLFCEFRIRVCCACSWKVPPVHCICMPMGQQMPGCS